MAIGPHWPDPAKKIIQFPHRPRAHTPLGEAVSPTKNLFSSWTAESIEESGTIRLPFGRGRTSPIAARDVAEAAAVILRHPSGYAGRVIELTGPRSTDLYTLAEEYAAALGRPVRYVEVPLEVWRDDELRKRGLPDHVYEHILTMAKLHAADRYNRLTDSVETILHRPATSLRTTLEQERSTFKASPLPRLP